MSKELTGIAKWGRDSGLSPDEFANELWKTVIALGGMMIDSHDEEEDSNTINITMETDNDQYDYKMNVTIERTEKEKIE